MALGQGVALDRVVPHLKPETITANPMLGAALELRVGHAEQARALLLRVRVDQLNERRIGYFSRLVDQAGRSPALVAVLREPRTAQAIAGTTARPQVIGPAQLQARQRILARADANKKLRERRRVEAVKKSTSPPSAGGFTFTPFPFPQQP